MASLLKNKLDRLDIIPDGFLIAMETVQRDLFDEMLRLLGTLDLQQGNITSNTANLAKIEGIINALENSMFEGAYIDDVKGFIKQFETQSLLNNQIYESILGSKFKTQDVFAAVRVRAQRDTLDLLNANAVEANFMAPLKSILNDSISTEQSFANAVTDVKNYIEGTAEVDGRLKSYAGTFVRDAFNRSDRRYMEVVSEEFELVWQSYAGSLVKDSRVFCTNRVGKVFHIMEIEEWGAGKNVDSGAAKGKERAGVPWQGMFRGTNPDNIRIVLGGHNCLHSLIPVSESVVPESTINRVEARGFIK